MERYQGQYALIQFSAAPERFEYVNIGIIVVVPSFNYVGVRFAMGQGRVERVFGKQPKAYFDAMKSSFESRLRDVGSKLADERVFLNFSSRRANQIRMPAMLAFVSTDAPEVLLDKLFAELVGDDAPVHREPRIRRRLRDEFAKHKVEQYLDKSVDVDLPDYGIKVNVPYGYQNGCYNLIDGMKLPHKTSECLKEAGKRAMEGSLIWKSYEKHENCKRLVVVGDFSAQPNEFYHAVREQFSESNVRLHRLDDMRALFSDIVDNAAEHGLIHPSQAGRLKHS